MHLDNFEQFRLSGVEATALDTDFRLVLSAVDLPAMSRTSESLLPSSSGCYFWIMRHDSDRYKIYLGRTKSLLKRVTDYVNEFQVHAPNDYKLRFFQESMAVHLPKATLDLYFTDVPASDSRTREKELVRRFRPLINTLPPPTEAERDVIRRAFEEYYRSSTARRLAE